MTAIGHTTSEFATLLPGSGAADDPALQAHLDTLRSRELSVPTVIEISAHDDAMRAAADLSRHFDADGLLLLQKTLVARLEPLLRRQPPRSLGLLRGVVQNVFERWRDESRAVTRIGERWVLRGLWFLLLVRAVLMPATRGWVKDRSERRFALGMPNKWGPPHADRVHHDLLLADSRLTPAAIIILAESDRYVEEYRRLGVTVIDVRRAMPVLRTWLHDVWPRLRALVRARLREPTVTPEGWLTSFAAWEAAWRSLNWECVFSAVHVDVVADIEEQNAVHAIKTCVLGRRGGKTLRLPHTQPDTPGTHTAFWMYHIVAVSSPYVAQEYGSTWWSESRVEPVGLMFNAAASRGAVPWLERVRERGPILALFTGSELGLQSRIHDALAAVAARILQMHPDVQLLIKPKPSHTTFLFEGPVRQILRAAIEEGRVTILDPASSTWCSAQDLLRAASVSLTYGGSIVSEALALGAPIVVFPVVPTHRTRWVDALSGRVIVDSAAMAIERVSELLAEPSRDQIDEPTRTEYCDPFRDGRALTRLRDLCLELGETV